MIRVAIKEPLKEVVITEIEGDYDSISKTVGGLIEAVYELDKDGITTWINEEGKCIHLSANMSIYDGQDCLCGTALFMNYHFPSEDDEDYEEGEKAIDLTDEQIKKIKEYCMKYSYNEAESKKVDAIVSRLY